jgi:magnesium transporter
MRLLKRIHPPGTSPGTITVPSEVESPPRAVLTRYSATDLEEITIEDVALLRAERRPGELWWLDVEGLDPALISELGSRLEVPPLVLEDLVNLGQRPKVEEYDDCVFVVADLVGQSSSDARITVEQVSFVLQDGLLMSFRERLGGVFEPIHRRLASGKGRIRVGGLDYLLYALLDAIVDSCFPILDTIGQRIAELEEELVEEGAGKQTVAELHVLRRDLVLMRRTAWPQREMVNRLLRSEDALVEHGTRVYLRDVADHLSMIVDVVETYREMVIGLMDLYLSTVSNRMNEVMKVLTIIATIFIPLSFIAGLYGMNFDRETSPLNMPELGWYWGYPAALLLMATVAGGLLIFFKRRDWI